MVSDFWTPLYVWQCTYFLIFHLIYLYAPSLTTEQMCIFLKNIQSNSNEAFPPPSIFYLNSAIQLAPCLCYGVSVCLDRMINYLSIWFLFWEIGSCAGWTCTWRNWFKWLTETPGVENSILIKKKKSRCCKELKEMRKYFKHQMIIRLHLHIILIRVLYLCCQNWKVYYWWDEIVTFFVENAMQE